MTEPVIGYHFVGANLRDGRPVPDDGVWLEYDGPMPPILFERGLHGSIDPFDALDYVAGATLCRDEYAGTIIHGDDNFVATRRRILERRDATAMARRFARRCACDVAHLWNCPPVVKEFLETGDECLREAARALAWAAKEEADWDEARGAAWAAWAAAWATESGTGKQATWAAMEAATAAKGASREAATDAAGKKYREWFRTEVDLLFSAPAAESR